MAEQQSDIAVLFVDIVDGTQPADRTNQAGSPTPYACRSILQEVATQYRGHMVSVTSDGAMCAFPDADSAVIAARAMQDRVQHEVAEQTLKIALRIGVHHGPAFIAGVVAQRLALQASTGDVLVSAEAKEQLSDERHDLARRHIVPRRNKDASITVYEIMSHISNPNELATRSVITGGWAGTPPPVLTLIHAGREIAVDASVTIGRRSSNTIVLKDPMVSRDHAYIERREDKFVLVDTSHHGTYVSLRSGEEYRVWRDEMVLHGNGTLSFARPSHEAGAETISFCCKPAMASARQ